MGSQKNWSSLRPIRGVAGLDFKANGSSVYDVARWKAIKAVPNTNRISNLYSGAIHLVKGRKQNYEKTDAIHTAVRVNS